MTTYDEVVPQLVLDGRMGEGGGQVLRTALGLALATGQGFAIHDIRGGRRKPGLLRQHLTAVRAVAAIYEREFRALGFETQWVALPAGMRRAGHFVATHRGTGDGPGPGVWAVADAIQLPLLRIFAAE